MSDSVLTAAYLFIDFDDFTRFFSAKHKKQVDIKELLKFLERSFVFKRKVIYLTQRMRSMSRFIEMLEGMGFEVVSKKCPYFVYNGTKLFTPDHASGLTVDAIKSVIDNVAGDDDAARCCVFCFRSFGYLPLVEYLSAFLPVYVAGGCYTTDYPPGMEKFSTLLDLTAVLDASPVFSKGGEHE